MREDIQCLRGIAILFVFLYHLFPTVFVNGFLGVDMFFVISGFLMAKNLGSLEPRTLKDIFTFYFKRFKRIFPLYYFFMFCSVVCVHLYLGDFWWKPNQRYSLASLFLITNQLVIHDQSDYFSQFLADESSKNAFLHMWSLSLEIQFYLLVPSIFFSLHHLKSDLLRLIAVSIMTLIGFLSFSLLNAQFAFNFMFLRLWQFSSGFTVFYWSKLPPRDNSEKSKFPKVQLSVDKSDLATAALVTLSFCLLPDRITVIFLRPAVTFATAVLIACNPNEIKIFKWSSLAYLGDISYIVYLVHWPVITIFIGTTVKSHVTCIVITLIISVCLHHFYEKPCLKLGVYPTVLIVISLIFANSFLQFSIRRHDFWKHTLSSDLQEIVDKNRYMALMLRDLSQRRDPCIEDTIPDKVKRGFFGYCRYPKGNGNTTVLMVGNSYTMNLAEPIRKQFNYNYSDFRYISIGENYGFYGGNEYSERALEISRRYAQLLQPDVLFLISRHSPNIRERVDEFNDKWIAEMNKNLAFYEKFVKRIYILGAHPLYKFNSMSLFLHYATQNREELENIHLIKTVADEEIRNIKKRISRVQCSKCQFFDLSHVFSESDKYLMFDRDSMLSYVDDDAHITPPGHALCEPVLEKIVNDAIWSL